MIFFNSSKIFLKINNNKKNRFKSDVKLNITGITLISDVSK